MARQKKEKIKSKKQIFHDTVNAVGFQPYTYTATGNIVWNQPYLFPDTEGSYRPQCINVGCIDPVAIFRGTIGEAKGREIRTVCSACHLASYRKTPLREGIVSHKKSYCENIDSHLGFPCTSTIHYSGVLELDHKDGNHLNNVPANVETLCKICHAYKSYIMGDHRKLSKQDTSPHTPQLNTSLPNPGLTPLTKNHPTPQTSIPCMPMNESQQSLNFEDTLPNNLSD